MPIIFNSKIFPKAKITAWFTKFLYYNTTIIFKLVEVSSFNTYSEKIYWRDFYIQLLMKTQRKNMT